MNLSEALPRSVSNPPHPADGMTLVVPIGEGAQQRIIDPRSFNDGGIVWQLTYGDPITFRYVTASLLCSYDSLLSHDISTKEAIRQLRILRSARRAAVTPKPD